MTDYKTRRKIMVDTQIRPSDVTKFPIIDAFLTIPREKFVPDGKREAAYIGENFQIGQNRIILEPRTEAEEILSEIGVDNVVVQVAKLEDGAPEHGPYDVIILQGGVEEIPASVLKQLKNGGRIGAIFIEKGLGTAKIGFKLNNKVTWRYSFNAAAPILPGFFKQKDFAL